MGGALKRTGAACARAWVTKTMKREISVALLLLWSVITIKLFWLTDVTLINALTGIYGIATPTIFMFAAAAFGFDAWAKQIKTQS